MLKLITRSGERLLFADENKTLLAVLHQEGCFVDAPCGGVGKCGKCKVYARGSLSPLTDTERELLSPQEIADSVRLACCTCVTGDAEVEILSRQDALVQTDARRNALVQTDARGGSENFAPRIRRKTVTVPEGSLHDQQDDTTRLLQAVGASSLTLTAIRHAPAALRARNGTVDAVLCGDTVLDVLPAGAPMLGMAVDIGTTTVVAYFHELDTGERLGLRSALNPQRAYGADVISRIAACKDGALPLQQQAVVSLLSGMAEDFCKSTGYSPDSIYHITVAANTTMLHLLTGVDPAHIAQAPFLAATRFGFDLTARALGLAASPDAPVSLLPCISAYVGADITAGMVANGLEDAEHRRVVYLDIGTNGEMAYVGGGRIICCATAAGPAFEGAHIQCGTGGVPGAVSGMQLLEDGFAFEVIPGEGTDPRKPTGICGSGLIDMTAALLSIGAVDETGRMVDKDELEAPWDSFLNDEGEFVFCKATQLRLTPKDIREVQLAKAAICAGIHTLLDTAGVTVDDLDCLLIAGGFGAHIRKESACAIGLLPPESLDKLEMVGNAAGLGAVCGLLDARMLTQMQSLAEKCEYLELSGSALFQDHYVEQIMFGDLDL